MGTRRRKRTTRKTRKKGGEWTHNKNLSVKRRQNLLMYTYKSNDKSKKANKAFHNYLEASQKNIPDDEITREDVLSAITPEGSMGTLINYRGYVKRNCQKLIDTKVGVLLSYKKVINKTRRLSKQAAFLANRAAIRVQQAAYIASIGRLSTSSVDDTVRHKLEEWNRTVNQRKASEEENKREALRLQNNSTILTQEMVLRYELTKQVAEHIQRLDYIIPLYESRDTSREIDAKTTKQSILEVFNFVRLNIVGKIPTFRGGINMTIDRAIPMITEEVYGMVLVRLDECITNGELRGLDLLRAQLQFFIIKKTLMDIVQKHFDILIIAYPELMKELSENPLLNKQLYKQNEIDMRKKRAEIDALERSINPASAPQSQ